MKILFLMRSFNYGGAERQAILLAKGLRDRGHQPVVAVFYCGGPLEKDLYEGGIPIIDLSKRGRWDLLRFFPRLVKVLRRERPDVLLGYLFEPNLLTVALKPFLPSCKIVWGVRNSNFEFDRYDWVFRLSFKLNCWLSRFADAIIANSRVGRDYHVSHGFPMASTLVIPNGIDTERFHPDSSSRRRIRGDWGVRDDDKLIGIVGRLAPMKDHPNFLRAAALLMREQSNLRFVCVGDGPPDYRASLYELAGTLGVTNQIIWVEGQKDMPAVYSALDVLVSSSSHGEGFANVIGEAMACGVPCAVTDVGDSAWVVGNRGEVVPAKDPEALKNAIGKLLDQMPYAAAQIRQRIVEELSADHLILKTEGLLHKLIQGRQWSHIWGVE